MGISGTIRAFNAQTNEMNDLQRSLHMIENRSQCKAAYLSVRVSMRCRYGRQYS